jgi:hypothetical protein
MAAQKVCTVSLFEVKAKGASSSRNHGFLVAHPSEEYFQIWELMLPLLKDCFRFVQERHHRVLVANTAEVEEE